MPTTASLTRGSNSVTWNVWEEGGSLALARDVGKPDLRFYEIGGNNPRFADTWSTLESFTCVGQLVGDSAYINAKRLAEGIVKPHHADNETILDLSAVSGFASDYKVAFPDAQALTLLYEAGQKNWVSLQLNAVSVNDTLGDRSDPDPVVTKTNGTAQGITLSDDAGNSIELRKGLEVERRVGRPNSPIRHTYRELPSWVDRYRAASDVFVLSGAFLGSTSRTEATELMEDILRPAAGWDALQLDFGGLYGLGSYDVVPAGSRSARVSVRVGEDGEMTWVDTLELRVVTDSFDEDELGGA